MATMPLRCCVIIVFNTNTHCPRKCIQIETHQFNESLLEYSAFFRYRIKQACGDPHRPIFTGECQLASIKCTGTASKKSNAKQLAFRAVLDIVQSFPQNEEQLQLAAIEQSNAESNQPTFQTYRELVKLGITPKVRNVCDRHMFFLDLPEDDRCEAHQILADPNATNEQKIDLICNALKLKYDFRNDRKIFVLISQHDCVVIGKTEKDLYDNVVNHFKVMLDFDEPIECH